MTDLADSLPTWSAPVRFVEVDQQQIVFNAHYLTYCDEAMGAFCIERGVLDLAEHSHLVRSELTWRASARWGDVVDVHATCVRVGTSSFDMRFVITATGAECCTVQTTYVHAIDGRSQPIPDKARALLTQAGRPAAPPG